MAYKIEKLTKEQEDMLPVLRDKWIEIGLRCEPTDKKTSRKALKLIYKELNMAPPELILWGRSPLEGAKIYDTLLQNKDDLEKLETKEDIRKFVRKALKAPDYKFVNKNKILNEVNYGQFEASWISYYAAFQEFGVTGLEILEGFKLLAQSAGWTWLLGNVAIVTERPEFIHLNDEKELHCEDGPALQFPDGESKYYYYNGVEVPSWVLTNPEKITVESIKKERNMEISRIMREKYGIGRYMTDTNSKIIHTDTVPVDVMVPKGDCITRALIRDDNDETYLVGTDGSTKRVYFMRVPNNVTTCEEAHKLLSGKNQNKIIMEG